MIVISDIDGVLADCTHRLHYLKLKDYDKFYSPKEMLNDKPIRSGLDLLYELQHCKIILITGRPYRTEETTRFWLQREFDPDFEPEIYMRKDHDYRPSDIVKTEVLQRLGVGEMEGSTIFFIDDDPKNITAVKTCFPNVQCLLFDTRKEEESSFLY